MEMPSLDQLQEAFEDENLSVVTINVQQTPPTIRQFKANYGFTLPVLLDQSGGVTKRYGATGLPETWILAPDNSPVVKIDGPLDWHADAVLELMKRLVTGSKD